MKILVVCSSNICRSPYCEFWLKKLISESDILKNAGIEVSSSAVFNKSIKIHDKALKCLVSEGFDENNIKAHKPTFKWGAWERFKQADVIIGMSKMHKFMTPIPFQKKYTTLSEIATGQYKNIPDPFLAPTQEEYNKVMEVIKGYLLLYIKKLEENYTQKAQ